MSGAGEAARFVGQRLARTEDVRLLTGRGAYTDDVVVPGMLHAAFVRSPTAKARIVGIDTAAARALPGVHAVLTAQDMATVPHRLFLAYGDPASTKPKWTPLAEDRVCHVGHAVVMVVARDRYVAEDAAALVDVRYEIEDPVVGFVNAADGPIVHPEWGSNLAHESNTPEDPAIDAIFAGAAHVVEGRITHQRQAHAPMEGRAVVAVPGPNELTVYIGCQSPAMAARYFTECLDMPDLNVRAVARDVGGAFGLKVQPSSDESAVVIAAMLLQVPVKWTEDRLENLTSAHQAREQEMTVRYAFDKDARLLAADLDYQSNLGAFPTGIDSNRMALTIFPGPYRLPKLRYRGRAWFTNMPGQAPYRGPWMIESLARETVLDVAARQIGIDPLELRRRNLITEADQPFTTITGYLVEKVTPLETLALAEGRIDIPAFRKEQAQAREQGRYLGLGMAVYIEPTTMARGGPLSSETVRITIEPTGKVKAVVSTHSQGHGTETTMAQVIADALGVDMADVTVLEDDSSRGGFGAGAGGSRQAVVGGGAAIRAGAIVRDKVRKIAGHLMNANPDDIQIERGAITVRGVPELTSTVREIARIAYFTPDRLPPDMELGLEGQVRYRPHTPMVFSNAAHACIVEVDAETGMIRILRWVASEDCGNLINPAVVEGQIAGGVAQGIGGVLMEHATYDARGNPTAATFKDYLLPTAHDIPVIEYAHMVTPSTTEGGFKGVGEGGAIIAPPTLVNAVADALAPFGVRCLDLPLSPERILDLIDGAREKGAG